MRAEDTGTRRLSLCEFARLEGGIRDQLVKRHLDTSLPSPIFQQDLEGAQHAAVRNEREIGRFTHRTEIFILDDGVDLAGVRQTILFDNQERLPVEPETTMDE